MLGHAGGLAKVRWPAYREDLAREEMHEVVIQVNGRVRAKIRVARDIDQTAAVAAAMADATVARFVSGPAKKIIFVPGRLLNIVV